MIRQTQRHPVDARKKLIRVEVELDGKLAKLVAADVVEAVLAADFHR